MMAALAAEHPISFDMQKKDRLAEIISEKSLIRQSGIKLASGVESNFYFDMKPTLFDPEGSNLIADLILRAIAGLKVDFIGGLEMGAVPIVASVCLKSFGREPIPGFFVRKRVKDHGTKRRVEGIPPNVELKDKHVLFVDDVTTTGGSVLSAVQAAQEAGCRVSTVVTVVDRCEGAYENLAAEGIDLIALLDARDFEI